MSEIKKFDLYLRLFKVLTLVSLIIFFLIALLFTYMLFMTFLFWNVTFVLYYFIFALRTITAWAGIGFIVISKRRVKKDYAHIASSHKTYIVGIGLIIIGFAIFISIYFRYAIGILVTIITTISIIGFLFSYYFLKKGEQLFKEYSKQILRSREEKEDSYYVIET